MSQSTSGPFRKFFGGLLNAVDLTRRVVLNGLFVIFLLVLALVIFGRSGPLQIQGDTTLVVQPEGTLVEQYSGSAMSRAMDKMQGEDTEEVQLRDLLGAITRGEKDPRITRMFLRVDRLNATGMASLHEVAAAIKSFRKAGKEVVAYGENMDQKQYYLAAMADKVYLHPSGSLMLEGLGRYRQYYREGLQDKLGVDVHLFRVGEFKAAAEPFIMDHASAESKEADLFWMNDLWQRYLGEVATARNLDAKELDAQVNDLPNLVESVGGDLALMAKKQGLVDGLATADEVRETLWEGQPDNEDGTSFRQVWMDEYLGVLGRETVPSLGGDQVRVVVAEGEIGDGDLPAGKIGGESTAALIEEAREDDRVKALVLRVNSPGGAVFPSELIRHQVELTRNAGKPVVVSMGDMAASGGYWISMNANRIYADPSTITGSIGIFGMVPDLHRALEKLGVRTDGVATNKFAGGLDVMRPMDKDMKRLVQSTIDHGYAKFIGNVATARKQSVKAIDQVARGRVWSGKQAMERGLVDAMGGLGDATAHAAKEAGLKTDSFSVVYAEPEMSGFERMMMDMSTSARGRAVAQKLGIVGLVVGQEKSAEIADQLSWLAPRQAGSAPVQAVAHCFCEL